VNNHEQAAALFTDDGIIKLFTAIITATAVFQ